MQPLTPICSNPAGFAPNLQAALTMEVNFPAALRVHGDAEFGSFSTQLRAVNLAGLRVDDYHLETARAASPGNDEIVSGEIGADASGNAVPDPDAVHSLDGSGENRWCRCADIRPDGRR